MDVRPVAKRISQYFADFISTDFKRQAAPRRRIQLTTETGFRSGMRVSKYPDLDRDLWAMLSQRIEDTRSLVVKPRKYTRPISPVLRKVIQEHVLAIREADVLRAQLSVIEHAKDTLPQAAKNPERWIEGVQTHLADQVADAIVRPLVTQLDGPLRTQAYAVVDSLHAALRDMVDAVCSDLSGVLPDSLAKLAATGDLSPVNESVPQFLTLESTQRALMAFFDGFVTSDAYLEFRDLETYVSTNDGMTLYLYVGAMRYGGNQYPLFFMPLEVKRDDDGSYAFKLGNQIFANRKAIDFALEQLAQARGRSWSSPVPERITYLKPEQTLFEEARVLFQRIANAFDLAGQIELSSRATDAATSAVGLSSALYLAAFDRADEALLNDYEAILSALETSGGKVVELFEGIVGGVLRSNPVSIAPDIEREWDALPMVDRMVFESPIPLNPEQRKVLMAVRHPQGKIVVVSGPPGTGKSHTITAIAADCAFRQRSCLILSDKNEALDVVSDKLSEAMSRVRHDREFPNPILRLGQQAANFKKLTSNSALTQITAFSKAMAANRDRVEAERQGKAAELKERLSTTVTTLGAIELSSVKAMHEDEAALQQRAPAVLQHLYDCRDLKAIPELEACLPSLESVEGYLRSIFEEGDFDRLSLVARVNRDAALLELPETARSVRWALFEQMDSDGLRTLSSLLHAYRELRMPVFGYLFRGSAVRDLERQLNALPVTQPLTLATAAQDLAALAEAATGLRMKLAAAGFESEFPAAYRALALGKRPPQSATEARRLVLLLRSINPSILDALLADERDDSGLWPLAVRFLIHWVKTRNAFESVPVIDYVGVKTQLERLNTSVLNSHVDARLLKFMEASRADAKALASVISDRQKFPEEKFEALKDSFPVIIANIREYAEFMPLSPEMFDVVVIDEASQVSVAQALPALLRAKKVVVLGDEKQYGNVKALQSSIEINEKYRSELTTYFRQNVSDAAADLARLSMFDIKRSILEFCNSAASYTIMLRAHFRSFPELISYSSSTFYNGLLQALKIRSVSVDEVIRFDEVDASTGKATRGTNEAEANFIVERLLELLEEEEPPTVGVITPFREQQVLLSKILFNHPRGVDFEKKLRLRVWTFDTCQGDERDIIFYSMVATRQHDALNYVFPVQMTDAQQAVEDKLKAQRLNVGFSRAKHTIWFVTSKPVGEFKGSIGQAMNHYANILADASRRASADEVDPNSPMESKVLEWFYQTRFYQANMDAIEVFPQFELGSYLKQLDPLYQHPAWRVDFLVIYQSDKGPVQIVIEYDGLEFHFNQRKNVHAGNYDRYLNEADVERQLTLEGYGYRFIRLNRFNLGSDPVQTISQRLFDLVELALGEPASNAVDAVQAQASGLASKDLKACPKCGEIKDQSAFFDPTLKSGAGGFGRICMSCKTPAASPKPSAPKRRFKRRWR
jgi:DNA polymerase III delta prime subunit